jgi:hypothetical protein
MIPSGYQYAECRGLLRHAWHEVPSDWTPEFGVPFTVRCERCNTERRDALQRNTGEVLSRRYIQPIGYKIEGDQRPKLVDFRLAWLDDHVAAMHERRREAGSK